MPPGLRQIVPQTGKKLSYQRGVQGGLQIFAHKIRNAELNLLEEIHVRKEASQMMLQSQRLTGEKVVPRVIRLLRKWWAFSP